MNTGSRSVRVSLPPADPYKPNAFFAWLYRRFFRHIHIDEAWTEAVRAAASKGTVVYVMRSLSVLDFLCLDYLVKRFTLPIIRFVNDLGLWILEPFGRGERRLRLRRQIPEELALGQTVLGGHSALLFLRRPPAFGTRRTKGAPAYSDLIRTLVETQRKLDTPILLVPQTFVWSKRPTSKQTSLIDLLFGPSEWPGRIRVFLQFLFNYRNALLRAGDPFDLARFVAENQELTDEQVADKVRYALLRRMERERAVVLGPSKKSVFRLRDEIVRSPRIRKHIEAAARTGNIRVEKVEREARRELDKLCAAPSLTVLSMFHFILDRVWNRIYAGLEVDRQGLQRVREAAREGPLVFLPSHKSHVDYLVLSDVLFANGMSPPMIAAGENLSFWPLGPFLRRAGAFFIRRSFKGKKLYSALVDGYMRKLLLEGHSIEFFLEGGRSRTGKLLPPKLGLLSMVVDASLALRGRKIQFVPISVVYERVVEQRSYVHELQGGDKQTENISGLLQTPRILTRRYGRVYLRFGNILGFDEMIDQVAPLPDSLFPAKLAADTQARAKLEDEKTGIETTLSPAKRRQLVQYIAQQAIHEINRVTIATPAAILATVLLGHRRRGISMRELTTSANELCAELVRLRAPIAPTCLDESDGFREDTMQEAIRLLHEGKLISRHEFGDETILSIPDDRRLALEYYKNNIIHFFVPEALVAAAFISLEDMATTESSLREQTRKLWKLFRFEFAYRSDATFEQVFDEALSHLVQDGVLERLADHLRTPGRKAQARIEQRAGILRPYFEAYRLALRGLQAIVSTPLTKKEWLKRTLALGKKLYAAGKIEQMESMSQQKLEAALSSLREAKLVDLKDTDTLHATDALKQPETIRELDARITIYLR